METGARAAHYPELACTAVSLVTEDSDQQLVQAAWFVNPNRTRTAADDAPCGGRAADFTSIRRAGSTSGTGTAISYKTTSYSTI
jgi:hypothetical protein